MAEQQAEQQDAQAEAKKRFEELQAELGPLLEKLQSEDKAEAADAAKRVLEILAEFRQLMGDETFQANEQLMQIYQLANSKLEG